MIFSQRIKEAISQSPYTQKQIATILNISESNITNWKNGDNYPSLEILYKLCLLLEVTSDYLLGLENDDGSRSTTTYEFEYDYNNTHLKHKEKK